MRSRMPSDDGAEELRWDDSRVFLAAYREGSLTRAAAKLGLNQSTTSRRITAFEAALGARLFDRTPEGLIPTELAQRVLGAAERAEEAMHEVARIGSAATEGVEGDVRLALSVGMSTYLVAPGLARLRERHPGLRVSFVVSTAIADLTRREADLAIRFVRPTSGDLVSQRIYEGTYGLYGSPAFAARLGRGPHRVDAIDFIGWGIDQDFFPEAIWERKAKVRIVARADELTTRITLAQHGAGAIQLPDDFGSSLPGLVRLAGVPAIPLRAEIYLVTHRSLRNVPRVRAVWQLVEELLAELTK